MVVAEAHKHMTKSFDEYKQRIDPHIYKEIDKLERLRERHKEVQLALPTFESVRTRKVAEIDDLFDQYVEWVSDTLEIEDNPNICIQAAFVGA